MIMDLYFVVKWNVLIKKHTQVISLPKLGIIVCLFHIKCRNEVRDNAFDMLLDLFRELVPNGKEELSNNFMLWKR